jgi:hypothetical protein
MGIRIGQRWRLLTLLYLQNIGKILHYSHKSAVFVVKTRNPNLDSDYSVGSGNMIEACLPTFATIQMTHIPSND